MTNDRFISCGFFESADKSKWHIEFDSNLCIVRKDNTNCTAMLVQAIRSGVVYDQNINEYPIPTDVLAKLKEYIQNKYTK